MISDYFSLSLRSLTNRQLRSWLTMIGIFIGIAAVVSLISLGQGMQDAIYQQFVALGANTVTVQAAGGGFGPPGTLAANNITENDLEKVQRVPGVSRAFGRLIRPTTVEFNDRKDFIYVGTLPNEPEDREFVLQARAIEVEYGRMLDPNSRTKILVGSKYREDNKFRQKVDVGSKLLINNKTFDVAGILRDTGSPEIRISFLMNEDPFKDLLGLEEEFDLIIAKTSEGADVNRVADSVERSLLTFRGLDEDEKDFTVQTSEELINTFQNILSIVSFVLIGIAGISLMVGGIGITNTMYTSVIERTREIGVMKAIGARNSDVMVLFLIESGLLGTAGGVIGVAIGMALSKSVEYAAHTYGGLSILQANFSPYLIFGSLIFSFVIGAASGVFPAMQAAKMDPVEALRK